MDCHIKFDTDRLRIGREISRSVGSLCGNMGAHGAWFEILKTPTNEMLSSRSGRTTCERLVLCGVPPTPARQGRQTA